MNKQAKIITTILSVVLVLALAVSGWLVWKNGQLKDELKRQGLENERILNEYKSQAKTDTNTQTSTDQNQPTQTSPITAQQKETIKASMDTMNTQPIESYMAPSVQVVMAASEGITAKSPVDAVLSLDYFATAKNPWDFDLTASVLSSYGKSLSYGKYFGENTYAGKAASGEIVSFHFNGDGKIDQIFMAISEDVFDY